MSELSDRRRAPRIFCDISVDYEVGGGRAQEGRIGNIGTLGTLLVTRKWEAAVGAELLLRFRLPLSRRRVETLGSVRWATQRRAGVEFVSLNPMDQDEIWRYFARESVTQRRLNDWRQFIRE